MIRRAITIGLCVIGGVWPVFAHAEYVTGNGYGLHQETTAASYEVEGNGYSVAQTTSIISAQVEGGDYKAVVAAPSVIADRQENTPPAPSPSVGGGSSGSSIGRSQDEQVASPPQTIGSVVGSLVETVRGELVNRYEDLGSVAYASEIGPAKVEAQQNVALAEIVGKTLNSKILFSAFSVAITIILFLALGVSVFGYNQVPRIFAAIIAVGSLLGFFSASDIYLLPLIVSVAAFFILVLKQHEREVFPVNPTEPI